MEQPNGFDEAFDGLIGVSRVIKHSTRRLSLRIEEALSASPVLRQQHSPEVQSPEYHDSLSHSPEPEEVKVKGRKTRRSTGLKRKADEEADNPKARKMASVDEKLDTIIEMVESVKQGLGSRITGVEDVLVDTNRKLDNNIREQAQTNKRLDKLESEMAD